MHTERPWSRAVTRALPGGLPGAALGSVPVRPVHIRALACGDTRVRDVAAFLEEVIGSRRADRVTVWRDELELACASALRAYERVRLRGPSVVPEEDA